MHVYNNRTGIQILSCNCLGLRDLQKRHDVFSYLRQKKYSIYCLQDTHFTKEIEHLVRTQWGYQCYFSNYSSNGRGVAILFNNNFEYKCLQEKKDLHGNMLALNLIIDNENLTLITIYGPNADTPNFFKDLLEIIDDFGNDDIIVCGDFNLVINPELDYENYLHTNNRAARQKVLEIMEERELVDCYRHLNPHTKRYTWRK